MKEICALLLWNTVIYIMERMLYHVQSEVIWCNVWSEDQVQPISRFYLFPGRVLWLGHVLEGQHPQIVTQLTETQHRLFGTSWTYACHWSQQNGPAAA